MSTVIADGSTGIGTLTSSLSLATSTTISGTGAGEHHATRHGGLNYDSTGSTNAAALMGCDTLHQLLSSNQIGFGHEPDRPSARAPAAWPSLFL